jgi:aspartate racemase
MKTTGVLGGMGPQATMEFEAAVHQVCQKLISQQTNEGYPPMVGYYFRQSPVIMPADGSMPTTRRATNPLLLDAARHHGNWTDFLVITSNGVHAFQDEIEQAAGRPVISMVDAVMEEIQRRGLKHIGLVDFRPSQFSVYMPRLNQAGLTWDYVPDEYLPRLTKVMRGVDEGNAGRSERETLLDSIIYLRSKQVDGIIPACTEFPLVLQEADKTSDVISP